MSSTPEAKVVGDPPEQRTTEDMLLKHSKIEAFASRAVAETYKALGVECRKSSYWGSLGTARVREGLRHLFSDDPITQFPPEAVELNAEQLKEKSRDHWAHAERLYEQLVTLVRRELAFE
ncbi:hypothetical protein ACTWJ8_15505 [Streptomyces sp. SDT5-1]|uniref:hypothetical protein n=1 Tax=Streptomyces sp. SDT5-1 TaxID=3406418 RepID=UPI003FD28D1A